MENYQFRGVSVETESMVFGELTETYKTGIPHIYYPQEFNYPVEVIPETVGLASSEKDRNGKTVFCGDILRRFKGSGEPYKGLKVAKYTGYSWENIWAASESEVIGDIHQHPHLIK